MTVLPPLNKKKQLSRSQKMAKQQKDARNKMWEGIDENRLWDRKKQKGFTTIPRTMPMILNIMDDLADKGKPISSTYFPLWCRVHDASFIEIKSYDLLAFESGFSGQRAVTTWKTRMKKLNDLGFISPKSGVLGEYSYVLIFNPHIILNDIKFQEGKRNALYSRGQEIGAVDLTL